MRILALSFRMRQNKVAAITWTLIKHGAVVEIEWEGVKIKTQPFVYPMLCHVVVR